MARYQMITEMLALWRGIFPLNSHIKFLLMINSDPLSLERSVGRLDDFGNRLTLLNLERSEVFATLIAADIGFLLREDRALNATASPVKFAEYLAGGLAVVSSPGVGDLSDRIIKRNLGVLVKPLRQSPEVPKLASFIRSFEKRQDRLFVTERCWPQEKNTAGRLIAIPITSFMLSLQRNKQGACQAPKQLCAG